ncbi:21826_t:CDS:2 [Rhizophagus irregularis]|nr:21826_t:CDS:2 [Rhizophagus irregularis]
MFLPQILRATRSHFPTLRKFSVRSASSVTNIPYVEANIKKDQELSKTISNEITKITTLSNGVRVTSENTPGHFSAVGVYIDVGSRYETPQTLGLSHMLDRLAFKSTKTHSIEQINSILESLGGNIMCASSREAVMYQSAIFSQDLSKVIALFSDVIRNPCITLKEVEEQKQTTLYEIQEIWQKPEMILPELLHTVAFKNNTLGNPMLCPEDRLMMMTPQLIKEYISTWYRPERMVLAVAGAQHEEIVELAMKHFANQKAHYTGGSLFLDQSIPHTHVYVAFEGLSIHDPDIYGLAILQMLLGGGGSFSAGGPGKGMYSRLFTNVLNQYNWMESCMCFNHCYTDSGLFGISASCRPEYNHHILDVIAQQLNSVTRFDHGGVTQSELLRAKNQLKSSLLMNLESRMVQLEDLGRQVQVHGYKISAEEMCKKIDKVTLEDLVRIASKVIGGQIRNEGNGTGEVTIVAQGELNGLKDMQTVCEQYGLGKTKNSKKFKMVA